MKSLCDTKPCCPARFWRIGMSSFGSLWASKSLTQYMRNWPFTRLAAPHLSFDMASILPTSVKALIFLKWLLTKGSIIKNVWPENGASLSSEKVILCKSRMGESLISIFWMGLSQRVSKYRFLLVFSRFFVFSGFPHGFSPKESSNIVFLFPTCFDSVHSYYPQDIFKNNWLLYIYAHKYIIYIHVETVYQNALR